MQETCYVHGTKHIWCMTSILTHFALEIAGTKCGTPLSLCMAATPLVIHLVLNLVPLLHLHMELHGLYHPRSVCEYQSDEWRSYPAFPSVYPPTPLPALASLPSPVAWSKLERHYPPILESALDFHLSLEQQSELKHPSSVCGSSKQCSNLSRVHSQHNLGKPGSESGDESRDIGSQLCLSECSSSGKTNNAIDHYLSLYIAIGHYLCNKCNNRIMASIPYPPYL